MALSWKLTAGSKESPHKGGGLNHSNLAWSGLEKLPMFLMLCILFTVGLMEFPWFFGQFVSEYGLGLLFNLRLR